jgi:hypothetical protein
VTGGPGSSRHDCRMRIAISPRFATRRRLIGRWTGGIANRRGVTVVSLSAKWLCQSHCHNDSERLEEGCKQMSQQMCRSWQRASDDRHLSTVLSSPHPRPWALYVDTWVIGGAAMISLCRGAEVDAVLVLFSCLQLNFLLDRPFTRY